VEISGAQHLVFAYQTKFSAFRNATLSTTTIVEEIALLSALFSEWQGKIAYNPNLAKFSETR
jgi:hypothetical protein